MNEAPQSHAFVMYGGEVDARGMTIYNQPTFYPGSPVPADDRRDSRPRQPCKAGVITVLPEETQAVIDALGLSEQPASGRLFHEGSFRPRWPHSDGRPSQVAALRSLAMGEDPAMAACYSLRDRYNPGTVVSAGIAGAIHSEVRPGDVVVATRVIHYDLRKKTPGGTRRRPEEFRAPAVTEDAVNAFFTRHDPPEVEVPVRGQPGATRTVRVHMGPIGSGNAVIADRDSGVLRDLTGYHDRILAVDMETAGIARACHEQAAATGQVHGWVAVRGISDDASQDKDDAFHEIAAWNAAAILRELLPYLP
jgi:nucleoside phosphorylase